MFSEARQLFELISARLSSSQTASLVEVMGHFDAINHLVPTTKEFNHALSMLTVPVTRISNSFVLSVAAPDAPQLQLSDCDVATIYAEYLLLLKSPLKGRAKP